MSTLEELKAGKLRGVKTLKLSCHLETFPEEILTLADTLEVLDLNGNYLDSLPPSLCQLKNLKILFLSFNKFKKIPPCIAQCKNLSILGFKSNQIDEVPEDIFPLSLRWLILTDNKIEQLPHSMGKLTRLEKLALAGNRLSMHFRMKWDNAKILVLFVSQLIT